jgi:hypothetical protein
MRDVLKDGGRALKPLQPVDIGTGGAPQGSDAATVSSCTTAGLAAHDAAGRPTPGVSWLDGGSTNTDPAVRSSLDSAGVWSKSSFVPASLDGAGACTWPAVFAATLRRYPVAAGMSEVSEAVQAPAPAAWVAAHLQLLQGIGGKRPRSFGSHVERLGRAGASMRVLECEIRQPWSGARPNLDQEGQPWMG